jgi:hypothetical protein
MPFLKKNDDFETMEITEIEKSHLYVEKKVE